MQLVSQKFSDDIKERIAEEERQAKNAQLTAFGSALTQEFGQQENIAYDEKLPELLGSWLYTVGEVQGQESTYPSFLTLNQATETLEFRPKTGDGEKSYAFQLTV